MSGRYNQMDRSPILTKYDKLESRNTIPLNDCSYNGAVSSPRKQISGSSNGKVYDVNSSADEKQTFIDSNAVRLDPGWDGTCTFKTEEAPGEREIFLREKIEQMESNPPFDKYKLVYLIMFIHGVGVLMPWNMFITAKSYFEDYKLYENITGNDTESGSSEYRNNFINYIGIASQFPNVALAAVNTFFHTKGRGSLSKRIFLAIILILVMFILTIVLAMIDTSSWIGVFFWVTIITVIIINMAGGIYQNSIFGISAVLPMKFTNAIVLGTNFCGTLTSVLNIVSVASAPDPRTAAIYYFVAAVVVLLLAFDSFILLTITKFYRHYKKLVNYNHEIHAHETKTAAVSSRPPYKTILSQVWVQAFNVWFTFFVSLSIFPGIQSNIKKISFPISDIYWSSIFCFLLFNSFAMLGSFTSEFIKVPRARYLWIPVLIRGIIFIPFFILCNYKPDERQFPVFIENDYVYIVGAVIMAFTSGYFSSLSMMYGPKLVDTKHAGTAGQLMAFCLILGVFTGVFFSLGVAKLVTYPWTS